VPRITRIQGFRALFSSLAIYFISECNFSKETAQRGISNLRSSQDIAGYRELKSAAGWGMEQTWKLAYGYKKIVNSPGKGLLKVENRIL
jgi:hypothetical protein